MKYRKNWKKKKKTRLQYLVKIFKSKREVKDFSDKQSVKKFIISRPVLQERLKEVLQEEKNDISQKHGFA